jgi:N-acetyl-gamma-glutamyl-phosphate reductase
MKNRVGIVGYRGFSGAELVRLLEKHSSVTPILLDHRDAAAPAALRRPSGPPRHQLSAEAIQDQQLALVFLATPAEASMELAPMILAAGAKVVDLSGAFRLRTPENYARWYKAAHAAPDLLAEAVYGLPEFCRDRIASARLLSNPGCYPTAANLALRPLVEAGLVDRSAGIVCDAKSGVSGAGNKPTPKNIFCEVAENFSAYSILNHRHVPEVLQVSGIEEREFTFTAQLLPLDRGILETIYFRTPPGTTVGTILDAYDRRYSAEPFIRIYNSGHTPDLRRVARTNFCDLGAAVDPATGRAVVVSAIDNLVKGAAGQAIQNMNLMLGFPETEALL